MPSPDLTVIAQAAGAGLFPDQEHLAFLDVATASEVAQEATQRLLRAGRLPWWPQASDTPPLVTVPDPWAALAAAPGDLLFMRVEIPDFGRYYARQHVIMIRPGLTPAEERATLWHELVHAERGDYKLDHPAANAAMEASCDRLAARRALPIGPLVEAWHRFGPSSDAVAAALLTTPRLLEVRMAHLTAAERRRVGSAAVAA